MNPLWLDERVQESLAVLSRHLDSHENFNSEMFDVARAGLSRYGLMGKHIRSRLVHIAAGQVDGSASEAAIVFGACVDLIHGAFLIHDDIIDRDDIRRGLPTLHRESSLVAESPHVGTSVAILAGDLGLTGAYSLLVNSQLNDSITRLALRRLTQSCSVTITGEILDVENSTVGLPSPSQVRLANKMKTADYTFACPLYLGSLAAGRDPKATEPIAQELGAAFQAANDIVGAEMDAVNSRTTLASIQALPDVTAECDAHINKARELIDSADLPQGVAENLRGVAEWISESVQEVH